MRCSLLHTLVLAGHHPDRRLLARAWDDAVDSEDWVSAAAVAGARGLPEHVRARIAACEQVGVRIAYVTNPEVSFADAAQVCRTDPRASVLAALKDTIAGPEDRAAYVGLLLEQAVAHPNRSELLPLVFADVTDADLATLPIGTAWPLVERAACAATTAGQLDFTIVTGEWGARACPDPGRPPARWLLRLRGSYASAALAHPGLHRAWSLHDPVGLTVHAALLCAPGRTAAQVDADAQAWLDTASGSDAAPTSPADRASVMLDALACLADSEESRRVCAVLVAVGGAEDDTAVRTLPSVPSPAEAVVADSDGFPGQDCARLAPDTAGHDPLRELRADTCEAPALLDFPDAGFLLVSGGYAAAPRALVRAVLRSLSREDDVARQGWAYAARRRLGPISVDLLRRAASRFGDDPATLAAIICCAEADVGFELLPASAKTDAAYLLLDCGDADLRSPAVVSHLLSVGAYADLPWPLARAILDAPAWGAQRGWTSQDAAQLADWFGTELEACAQPGAAWTVVEKLAGTYPGSVGSLLRTVGDLLDLPRKDYPRVASRPGPPVRLQRVPKRFGIQ